MNHIRPIIIVVVVSLVLPTASSDGQTIDMAKARSFYLRDIAVLKDYRSGRVTQCPFVPPALQPKQTCILLDLAGSGFLTHVWATGHWKDEWVSFYFDGEEKASIEGKWADIFSQSNAVSETISRLPFALQQLPTGISAFNCYIPMPFKRSVKVTVQNRGTTEIADIYFIFDYILRPASETPDCRLQFDPKAKRFSYVGRDAGRDIFPLRRAANAQVVVGGDLVGKESQATIKPGQKKSTIEIPGTGVVERLELTCQTPSAVMVRMFYDDAKAAAIACRLDRLFGMRSSMILEHEGTSYVFHLPMPFRKRWRMELENVSQQDVSVSAAVACRITRSLPDDYAYLHAAWNAAEGKDSVSYPLFSASGRGHFVGMLLYQPTTTVRPSDHAGADFIYGDASTSQPFTLRANGGEDYFGAAYFGDDYATPFVGATKDYMQGGMRYRFHLESPIPFTESINVDFAQFRGNSYASVAFWYQDTPADSPSMASIPWKCLGPFDPNAVPDDVKVLPVEASAQPDFSKTYPTSLRNGSGSRFERQARWRDQVARGGFVDSTADDVLPVNGVDGSSWVMDSVWYAMTHLILARQQEVTLLIGHDDPVDVYIDGELTASFGSESQFTTSRARVSLSEGKHRIVVKNRNTLHPATFLWDAFSLIIKDSQGNILPASQFFI